MRQGYWSIAAIIVLVCFLWVFAKLHPATREKPLEALDIDFPALALYGALARFGCFSAGCCHGKPAWDLPWAVVFDHPASSSIYRGIPVHPTQLYEAAGDLVIFSLLIALRNRPAFKGALIWVYLLAYGLLRFCVEFYRGDVRPMVGLLSLNQVICIAFIVIGSAMLARRFAFRDRGFAICGFRF
jgi:phosphatidylglycerol:prolipoprotein diacylglycerol transferase